MAFQSSLWLAGMPAKLSGWSLSHFDSFRAIPRRREQMTTKAVVATVFGILAVFLLEALAVLAWG